MYEETEGLVNAAHQMDEVGKAYSLPVASLQFEALVAESIVLPPYGGSTLRGAFGHALRDVGCLYRHEGPPCEQCRENADALTTERPTQCVYGYLFDTPRSPYAQLHERQQEVPHPYVIRPPQGAGRLYAPGETLVFEVQLCGLALHLASYVVDACVRLTLGGLGAGRGKSVIHAAWEQDPFGVQRLPLPSFPEPSALQLVVSWEQALAQAHALSPRALALQFLTPAYVVRDKVPVEVPDFATVMRALLRRLTALALFHGGAAPEEHFRALAHEAESVRLVAWDGTWHSWNRYSSRQNRHTPLGGFTGTAVYEGDLSSYLPYLVYGQALHIGKACVLGNGRYRIVGGGTAPPD